MSLPADDAIQPAATSDAIADLVISLTFVQQLGSV